MGLFDKRTADEVGGSMEWASVPGAYEVEVTGAYDSNVVYPDEVGKKSRHIGMTVKLLAPVQGEGESDEDFADRQEEVGKFSRPRVYLSEKSVTTGLKLLNEIAGSASLPADFEAKAIVDASNPDNPVYDLKLVAEEAPINPGQLIKRRFLAVLEVHNNGAKGLRLNPYASWQLDESKQASEPRNLFDGEDTVSAAVKARIDRKNNADTGSSSRTEGLNLDVDEDAVPAGVDGKSGLPF